MSEFQTGDLIGIPCKAKESGIKKERLIEIQSLEGEMVGFVRTLDLRQVEGGWQVRGIVDKVERDSLVAWVRGNFFKTAGWVRLRKDSVVEA